MAFKAVKNFFLQRICAILESTSYKYSAMFFYKFCKNLDKKRTSVTQALKIRISHARRVLIGNVTVYKQGPVWTNEAIDATLTAFLSCYFSLCLETAFI